MAKQTVQHEAAVKQPQIVDPEPKGVRATTPGYALSLLMVKSWLIPTRLASWLQNVTRLQLFAPAPQSVARLVANATQFSEERDRTVGGKCSILFFELSLQERVVYPVRQFSYQPMGNVNSSTPGADANQSTSQSASQS